MFGSDVRSLQVQVRPDDLMRYNVAIDDVLAAAKKATGVRGAGFIETANQRIVLQTEGQSLDPEELARTVSQLGRLERAAEGRRRCRNAPEPPIGGAADHGQAGRRVARVRPARRQHDRRHRPRRGGARGPAPGDREGRVELQADLFRPADFIDISTRNVHQSLLLGGVLVVVVLFLFLFDLRTATISCIAIPLSLLAAVVVLNCARRNLNTMTLGGLAIAIGEVVDDAVIDVENIVRRLRENRRSANPLPIGRS